MKDDCVADAIHENFSSPNVPDANGEMANVADVLYDIARAGHSVANAITAQAAPGHDATGGSISSLTEAAMGITAALVQIANAIQELAEAVKER